MTCLPHSWLVETGLSEDDRWETASNPYQNNRAEMSSRGKGTQIETMSPNCSSLSTIVS